MAAQIFKISARLVANTRDFTSKLKQSGKLSESTARKIGKDFKAVSKSFTDLGKKLTKAFILPLVALGYAIDRTILSMDSLIKKGNQLGISLRKAEILKFIAEDNASSVESLVMGMINLNKNLFQGTAAMKDYFNQLGPGVEDALKSTTDPVARLRILAEALEGVSVLGKKASAVTFLMGRAGKDLVPILVQGGEAFDKMTASAEKYTLPITKEEQSVIAATANSLQKLGLQFKRLFFELIRPSISIIQKLVQGFADFLHKINDALKNMPLVAEIIGDFTVGILGLIGSIGLLLITVGGLIGFLFRNFMPVFLTSIKMLKLFGLSSRFARIHLDEMMKKLNTGNKIIRLINKKTATTILRFRHLIKYTHRLGYSLRKTNPIFSFFLMKVSSLTKYLVRFGLALKLTNKIIWSNTVAILANTAAWLSSPIGMIIVAIAGTFLIFKIATDKAFNAFINGMGLMRAAGEGAYMVWVGIASGFKALWGDSLGFVINMFDRLAKMILWVTKLIVDFVNFFANIASLFVGFVDIDPFSGFSKDLEKIQTSFTSDITVRNERNRENKAEYQKDIDAAIGGSTVWGEELVKKVDKLGEQQAQSNAIMHKIVRGQEGRAGIPKRRVSLYAG